LHDSFGIPPSAFSLLAQSSDQGFVKVYFLRTDPGFDGVSGNALTISLAGQDLLTLAKGEYALVYLKNYSGDVTVESSTVALRGGLNTWVKAKEAQHFDFAWPQTYYITFRKVLSDLGSGTPYVAQRITEDVAQDLARQLKPVGGAANHPL